MKRIKYFLLCHSHCHYMENGHCQPQSAIDDGHCILEPQLGQVTMLVHVGELTEERQVIIDTQNVRIKEQVEKEPE